MLKSTLHEVHIQIETDHRWIQFTNTLNNYENKQNESPNPILPPLLTIIWQPLIYFTQLDLKPLNNTKSIINIIYNKLYRSVPIKQHIFCWIFNLTFPIHHRRMRLHHIPQYYIKKNKRNKGIGNPFFSFNLNRKFLNLVCHLSPRKINHHE